MPGDVVIHALRLIEPVADQGAYAMFADGIADDLRTAREAARALAEAPETHR
ncbi:MAG TPA: hypothetical protein VFG35_05910 [Actinoplanes sp.]|nr:hypothetical protein [Actinoplanes sp.]